jgi:hypothetical protein
VLGGASSRGTRGGGGPELVSRPVNGFRAGKAGLTYTYLLLKQSGRVKVHIFVIC